jgi:hypothetical protein
VNVGKLESTKKEEKNEVEAEGGLKILKFHGSCYIR